MWPATRTERTQGGFTLLEILVALAIFSIASLIAYRGLDAVASTKAALDQEIRFWRDLGLVFDRMESDFVQTLPHVFASDQGTIQPPLRGATANDSGFFIDISRFDGERTPVHVVYRCENGELNLALQALNSRSSTTRPVPNITLLKNVEQCEVAFLGAENSWLSSWPGDQSQLKPRAVRIRLSLAGRGQFERLYYLP
jgi:general secretion pathway protein J